MDEPVNEATRVLTTLSGGDTAAADRLLPLVYDELRAVAAAYLRRQRTDHTLQPTALVHEAYLRLIDQTGAKWNDRAHFFAVAATAMRQILVNHAEARSALKRGGGRLRMSLEGAATPALESDDELLSLDEAMRRLESFDSRKCRVVELRFFGGLTMEEIAHVLAVSKTTVEGDWRMARAWLSEQLEENGHDDGGAIPEA